MNDQELISRIEEFGLSNKEARVYVACLGTGPSSVQRISDKSGIKRVTTYVVLESLIGLGLVSQGVKGKKTYFIAEDPSNLKRMLEKREQEIHDQKANFEETLPELYKLVATPTELPEVRFYDGIDGLRSLFATFYATHKGSSSDVYALSNLDQVHAFFPELNSGKPNADRAKHNIKGHLIYTTTRGPIYRDSDENTNRVSRFVPPEEYPLTGDINVFDDYVILISFAEERPIGVSIRNAEMAKGMKAIFDMSWKTAEKYNNPE